MKYALECVTLRKGEILKEDILAPVELLIFNLCLIEVSDYNSFYYSLLYLWVVFRFHVSYMLMYGPLGRMGKECGLI
jgi:hypothetical protein